MRVDFLDLKVQYLSIQSEIQAQLLAVLDSCAFTGGKFVQQFEAQFSELHQVPFCVGVNNGTSALHLTMLALDIGPGDEVIVPTNTFFASAEAVSLAGAKPVFVDCENEFYNIDPKQLEQALTPKTKAVIGVHLYGQPANMQALTTFCQQHGLFLIEDCAQAHLAEYQDIPVGNFGIAGCFSFYPGKNLGAYGEAGAIVTKDEALYKKMCAIRDHGASQKYHHDYIGHNYRMSGFQGAVLGVKAKYIQAWTDARIHNANLYDQLLKDVSEIQLPKRRADSKHVYHLYVIQTSERDALMAYLNEQGIFCGIHYPIPCHRQKAYEHLQLPEGSFPVAESTAKKILSLPMYPELTEEKIQYVCDHIQQYFQHR